MSWHASGHAPPDDPQRPIPIAATVDGRALLLVPVDGSWHAIEDRCSHAGCEFSTDGTVEGPHVICECHGSEFDVRTGEVLRPPAQVPIAVFPARVAEGVIEVEW